MITRFGDFTPLCTFSSFPDRRSSSSPEYPIPSSAFPQTCLSSSKTNRKAPSRANARWTPPPGSIRISKCASNLDKRLSFLKGDSDVGETPEVRLETVFNSSDRASPPPPPSSPAKTLAPRRQRPPTTLLPSKAHNAPPAHRAHLSALLRLLYLHNMLNPAVQSPHVPWLFVPLYRAIARETDEDDVAHAEADTFWVFEALVGEIAERGKIWT